jgi:hypothetical protein
MGRTPTHPSLVEDLEAGHDRDILRGLIEGGRGSREGIVDGGVGGVEEITQKRDVANMRARRLPATTSRNIGVF